jgi:hypothetical protein
MPMIWQKFPFKMQANVATGRYRTILFSAEIALLSISAVIFVISTYCLLEPVLGNNPA